MDLGLLTEPHVRALAAERIVARGDAYCRRGAVLHLALRGDVLHAEVAGTADEPYAVRLTTRGDRILARCDCPYAEEWGEWCKHAVAAALAVARGTLPVERQPTVRELVAPLDRAALVRVLDALVEHDPRVYDAVRLGIEGPSHRGRP